MKIYLILESDSFLNGGIISNNVMVLKERRCFRFIYIAKPQPCDPQLKVAYVE